MVGLCSFDLELLKIMMCIVLEKNGWIVMIAESWLDILSVNWLCWMIENDILDVNCEEEISWSWKVCV